jgi:hypothetical protein
MATTGGGARWLRYGCFGCLGALALLILFSGGVAGLAWFKASSEEVDSKESDYPLPVTAVDSTEAPVTPGAVLVEIEARARLEIEPGPQGAPLRVEATYDTSSFELQESMEGSEDSGWTYRLGFRETGSSWLGGLSRLFGGSRPSLRILLPADVPMTLALTMAQGEAEAQLGGLELTSADIDIQQGGMQLEFDEPMRAPMESLAIRVAMGGFAVEQIGNASPRELSIDCSMGGAFIDLSGAWAADSEIDIQASLGGAALRLPRDVHVVGLETTHVRPMRESEIPRPTLTFSVTTGTGGDIDVIE